MLDQLVLAGLGFFLSLTWLANRKEIILDD